MIKSVFFIITFLIYHFFFFFNDTAPTEFSPLPLHDALPTSGPPGSFGYFGAAAGAPTLGYYSYDLGAWHIVVLNNSQTMTAGSTQEQWLRADLAAHPSQCKIGRAHV